MYHYIRIYYYLCLCRGSVFSYGQEYLPDVKLRILLDFFPALFIVRLLQYVTMRYQCCGYSEYVYR